MHVERKAEQRDLKLRKVIVQFSLGWEAGMLMSMVMTR